MAGPYHGRDDTTAARPRGLQMPGPGQQTPPAEALATAPARHLVTAAVLLDRVATPGTTLHVHLGYVHF